MSKLHGHCARGYLLMEHRSCISDPLVAAIKVARTRMPPPGGYSSHHKSMLPLSTVCWIAQGFCDRIQSLHYPFELLSLIFINTVHVVLKKEMVYEGNAEICL